MKGTGCRNAVPHLRLRLRLDRRIGIESIGTIRSLLASQGLSVAAPCLLQGLRGTCMARGATPGGVPAARQGGCARGHSSDGQGGHAKAGTHIRIFLDSARSSFSGVPAARSVLAWPRLQVRTLFVARCTSFSVPCRCGGTGEVSCCSRRTVDPRTQRAAAARSSAGSGDLPRGSQRLAAARSGS